MNNDKTRQRVWAYPFERCEAVVDRSGEGVLRGETTQVARVNA